MPFDPVEDIPDLETKGVHIKKMDRAMNSLVNNTRFALKSKNLRRKSKDDKDLVRLLSDHLALYTTCHKSIRILLRYAYRNKDYPVISDATSLVREQVEKVFSFAAWLQNPSKYIRLYLRHDYRKYYEEWLLLKSEFGGIRRYHQYLHEEYPAFLAGIRKPAARMRLGPEILVSTFAERVLIYYWNNPTAKNPSWFKHRKSMRNYLSNYFDFPTPGLIAKAIKNKNQKRFLYRWNKDYRHLCDYTHVAMRKMLIQSMSEFKHMEIAEKVRTIAEKQAERTLFTSYAATASACTLVIIRIKNDYGVQAELRDFWQELAGASLICKAYWNIYIKEVLR